MVAGNLPIGRGSIWLAQFDPTTGSETQKTRPCLVVSPPEICGLRTILAAPMTTGSHPAPYRVPIAFGDRAGLMLLDQVRSLDRRRLVKRLDDAPPDVCARVLSVLREMFAD